MIEYITKFQEYLENNYYSNDTQRTYISNTHKFLVDLEIKNIEEITAKRLSEYRNYLVQNKYAGQTINTKFESIRSFLKFLYYDLGWIAPVVLETENRIKINLPEIKLRVKDRFYKKELSIFEVKRILREIQKENNRFYLLRDTILIQLLASTGMRIFEALQLEIDHVITGRVEIMGKRSKIRTILIPATIIKQCKLYIKLRNELNLNNKKLFIDVHDKEIGKQICLLRFKKYGIAAKVKKDKLFLHNLRHFYTIDAIKQGQDLNTLAQNLGIESMEILKIYQARDIHKMQNETNKKGRRLNV